MVIKKLSLTKGQVHTLEAVSAAILILTGVVFAQLVTSITPMTASTASQQAENQQGELAKGFTSITSNNGYLKRTLLYWSETNARFHNASGPTPYYTMNTPNSKFGNAIQKHFIENGLGIRMDIIYYRRTSSGKLETVRIPYIDFGTPSNHAYTASTNITLYDSDNLIKANGSKSSIELKNSSTYLMGDIDPNSEVYNVVEVRIHVWRI